MCRERSWEVSVFGEGGKVSVCREGRWGHVGREGECVGWVGKCVQGGREGECV